MNVKNQKGLVIEIMIIAMLVTFGICMALITFVGSMSAERKNAKKQIDSQTVLNQVGEYFIRAVENGGMFPSEINNKTDFSKYPWMDDNGDKVFDDNDETVRFFKDNDNFKYSDKISATYAGFIDFYKTKSVTRRLTVTNDGVTKMVLTVKENYVEKNISDCEILTWYIGDGVVGEKEEEFQDTKLNILQLLWKFFGQLSGDIRDASLFQSGSSIFRDIFSFFKITSENWNDIVREGIGGGVVVK